MNIFGENLKAYRKILGLNQNELAQLVGLKQSTIANYENGIRFPKKVNLTALSLKLNVSIDALLTRPIDMLQIPFQEDFYGFTQKQFLHALLNWNEKKAIEIIKTCSNQSASLFHIHEKVIKHSLYEIGELWSLGRISVIQEHYATQVCLKAVAMISLQIEANKLSDATAICMAINPEEHNLGVRIIGDVLQSIGINAYFIGSKIPTESLIQSLIAHHITFLALSISLKSHLDGLCNLINRIRSEERLGNLKIIVGGYVFIDHENLWIQTGADFYAKDSFDLIEKIKDYKIL